MQLSSDYRVSGFNKKTVPYILNREKNGVCPIEKSVMDVQDPKTALVNIRQTIQEFMAKKK